jgi:hypothetical protein
MSAKLVPTIKTTCTQSELIKGYIQGWNRQFGSIPSKQAVGVLYAQNTLETGGTTSMWNWNLGNVKFVASNTPADDNIEYMMLANVWEIIHGQKVIFQPPSPATWFRSFNSLSEGVAFELDFLKNHRYKAAWAAVEAGDPAEFSHLLKVAGYYSAPEIDYTKLMNFYFNKFMKDTTYEQVTGQSLPVVSIPDTVTAPQLTTIVPVPQIEVPQPEPTVSPVIAPIQAPVTSSPVSFDSIGKIIMTIIELLFPVIKLIKK